MIEINGLSKKQVKLLNIMWSINDMDDVQEWIETLSPEDQSECFTLMNLIRIEVIDEFTEHGFDYTEANKIIDKIKSI